MSTNQVMLKLSSNPRNITMLESFVKRICQKHCIQNQDLYGNILISLTEAVNNAIIHGNKNDERKNVQVSLRELTNCICFKVSDEGKGFDYHSLPDPTAPENRSKCCGRGVFLMQQLCDDIRFHDNGRTVEMRFHL